MNIRVETIKSHTLAEAARVEAMTAVILEKVLFHAGFQKTVDMFPLTNGLRRTKQKFDMFRCIRLDLFLRTHGAVDIKMDVSSHVETVCLLSKLNVEHHIEVELNLYEMDLTAAESKIGYEEIKAYVLGKFGLEISNLYIVQVKRKCGIIERKNYICQSLRIPDSLSVRRRRRGQSGRHWSILRWFDDSIE